MKPTLPLCLALIAAPAFAEDTREADAHIHGMGELNIAVDGTTVAMEFHAPGADIVGFEYEPKSDQDRAAIDAAIAALSKPMDLFAMPTAAECSVTKASAALESEAEHDDDHDHEEDHAKKDDDHDDHAHDEDKHDDHDDHAEEASHTEFHAEYTLTCATPSALDKITFAYFDTFENAQEVEVQIVTASGAKAFDVDRGAPVLDLGGLF